MPCLNCGNENVELKEGQFFCTDCASQQLAAREETVAEETLNISRWNIVGSTTTNESSSVASSSNTENNPCSVYHCYNILLYKQVSALIHLGVSEKLKNVVLFMWAKYLQKCEALFLERNTDDLKKPNGIKTNNTSVNKKIKSKKKNKNIENNNQPINDSDASGNDSMEVDEPSGAAFISNSKNFWSHYETGQKRGVDRMCLPKTLCFCYLGLLYTRDRLLLTDFLRLVQEERIPYLEAFEYIPDSMWKQFPRALFTEKYVPDVSVISSTCSQLIHFLELPKVQNRSLLPIALQFVKDLNLPDNIVHIVKILTENINNKKRSSSDDSFIAGKIPLYEVEAIALIIIVLKIFYVLDGEYELNHSEVSRKINIILKDQRLFVWDQWQKQASLKEYLFLKPSSNCRKISLLDSLSASQIVSKYPVCSKGSSDVSKDYWYASRQNIAKVFNSLRSGNETVPERPAPTSFPLTQNLCDFIEHWKNLPLYKETKEIDFSLLTEKFASDILFYKPSSNEDESSREIIQLLTDSLYKSLPCLDGSISNLFQTSSNYWNKIPTKYDRALIWLNDFSPSFQWLIKFMSKYINTSCEVVYLQVLRMEKKILSPGNT